MIFQGDRHCYCPSADDSVPRRISNDHFGKLSDDIWEAQIVEIYNETRNKKIFLKSIDFLDVNL